MKKHNFAILATLLLFISIGTTAYDYCFAHGCRSGVFCGGAPVAGGGTSDRSGLVGPRCPGEHGADCHCSSRRHELGQMVSGYFTVPDFRSCE